jgi:predicted RecA/RadA family phage recombinase
MGRYIQPGDVVTLTAPSGGFTVGTPKMIGSILVMPLVTGAEGVAVACQVSGVVLGTKTSAQAWTEGQKIFWNVSTSKFDSDSTTGALVGVAVVAADNPSSEGYVRLNGVAPATAEGAQAAVVVLTDSTGVSGSHDDTIADGLTAVAPVAPDAYAAVVNMSEPVAKAEGEAVSAALANLRDEVAALTIVVAACVTDLTVQNQNDSDLAQKVIEIRAALVAAGIITA